MDKDTALKMAKSTLDKLSQRLENKDCGYVCSKVFKDYRKTISVIEKQINACKEALKPHPDCDEACMFQCQMEKEHNMTYDQGFEHGYEAHRVESQEQEPVACPYPCGWDNLYKITTEKGAYLVTHFDIDNPMPYSYWQEISSMVDTARTLVKWGMNIKSHPAQPLSDDEIERIACKDEFWFEEGYGRLKFSYTKFARAIEKAHGIGD